MAGYKGNGINPSKFDRSQIKIYIILLPLAVFMLFPIVFIFCHAFKPPAELFAFPPRFYVVNPTLDNFSELLKSARNAGVPLSRYVMNSVFVTAVVCVANIIMSTMAAFALSKMKFKTRGLIFNINQKAMMFVPAAVLIPRYLIMNGMGILNTYWAHILPLIAMPVSLFLIKQFVDGVPDALIEAAKIDGAGQFRIWSNIVLPISKPVMATIGMFAAFGYWNDWFQASLYIQDKNLQTLQSLLNNIQKNIEYIANNPYGGLSLQQYKMGMPTESVRMAIAIIIIVPIACTYPFFQKYFISGLTIGGVKE